MAQAVSPVDKVRPPAVAGLFYAEHPSRLQADVTRLLAGAPDVGGAPPKAVIAPHAGYVYSGAVAATAFASLGDHARTIRRVVLIGPAHYVSLRGIAIPSADAFA